MEKKIKHLEMIQGVINRMASNSFALKGWAVTLVAGIFALASKDSDKMYFLIVYVPVVVFWGLDSYYLLQERLYRALYGKVRKMDEEEIDFDLNANREEFKNDRKNTWANCMLSSTEKWFYIPMALICTIVIVLTHLDFIITIFSR